jgi:hypothetical protein
MRVAMFQDSSQYRHSSGLVYENGEFVILGAGATTREHVAQMDEAGELVWLSPDVRTQVVADSSAKLAAQTVAVADPQPPTVAPSGTSRHGARRRVVLAATACVAAVLVLVALVLVGGYLYTMNIGPRQRGSIPKIGALVGMDARLAEDALRPFGTREARPRYDWDDPKVARRVEYTFADIASSSEYGEPVDVDLLLDSGGRVIAANVSHAAVLSSSLSGEVNPRMVASTLGASREVDLAVWTHITDGYWTGFAQRPDGAWMAVSGSGTFSVGFDTTSTPLSDAVDRKRALTTLREDFVSEMNRLAAVISQYGGNPAETLAATKAAISVQNPELDAALRKEMGAATSSAGDSGSGGFAGANQKGRSLYFVLYASESSKAAADAKYSKVVGMLEGPAQYVFVGRSNDFEGMAPGWWIVAMPCEEQNVAEGESAFAKRNGLDGYVKQATVKTDSPISVNDAVGD